MDACRDCEDTPLSVGAAHRVSTHVELDSAILPTALPSGTRKRAARLRAPRAATPASPPSRFTNRSPLLRC
jgi:hypothetical protein